jgi:hypothetical protein
MGYGRTGAYHSDLPGASTSKRGAVQFYPVRLRSPLIDLSLWCAANRAYLADAAHPVTFKAFRGRDQMVWSAAMRDCL